MIDHVSTYTTDFDKAQAFYDATLSELGSKRIVNMVMTWDTEFPNRRCCAYGPGPRPVFWLVETKAPHTPRHTAFTAPSRDAVRSFHAAGVSTGGTDNGAPGPREHYHTDYFGGFLIDPDGNNVEAVIHEAPVPS